MGGRRVWQIRRQEREIHKQISRGMRLRESQPTQEAWRESTRETIPREMSVSDQSFIRERRKILPKYRYTRKNRLGGFTLPVVLYGEPTRKPLSSDKDLIPGVGVDNLSREIKGGITQWEANLRGVQRSIATTPEIEQSKQRKDYKSLLLESFYTYLFDLDLARPFPPKSHMKEFLQRMGMRYMIRNLRYPDEYNKTAEWVGEEIIREVNRFSSKIYSGLSIGELNPKKATIRLSSIKKQSLENLNDLLKSLAVSEIDKDNVKTLESYFSSYPHRITLKSPRLLSYVNVRVNDQPYYAVFRIDGIDPTTNEMLYSLLSFQPGDFYIQTEREVDPINLYKLLGSSAMSRRRLDENYIKLIDFPETEKPTTMEHFPRTLPLPVPHPSTTRTELSFGGFHDRSHRARRTNQGLKQYVKGIARPKMISEYLRKFEPVPKVKVREVKVTPLNELEPYLTDPQLSVPTEIVDRITDYAEGIKYKKRVWFGQLEPSQLSLHIEGIYKSAFPQIRGLLEALEIKEINSETIKKLENHLFSKIQGIGYKPPFISVFVNTEVDNEPYHTVLEVKYINPESGYIGYNLVRFFDGYRNFESSTDLQPATLLKLLQTFPVKVSKETPLSLVEGRSYCAGCYERSGIHREWCQYKPIEVPQVVLQKKHEVVQESLPPIVVETPKLEPAEVQTQPETPTWEKNLEEITVPSDFGTTRTPEVSAAEKVQEIKEERPALRPTISLKTYPREQAIQDALVAMENLEKLGVYGDIEGKSLIDVVAEILPYLKRAGLTDGAVKVSESLLLDIEGLDDGSSKEIIFPDGTRYAISKYIPEGVDEVTQEIPIVTSPREQLTQKTQLSVPLTKYIEDRLNGWEDGKKLFVSELAREITKETGTEISNIKARINQDLLEAYGFVWADRGVYIKPTRVSIQEQPHAVSVTTSGENLKSLTVDKISGFDMSTPIEKLREYISKEFIEKLKEQANVALDSSGQIISQYKSPMAQQMGKEVIATAKTKINSSISGMEERLTKELYGELERTRNMLKAVEELESYVGAGTVQAGVTQPQMIKVPEPTGKVVPVEYIRDRLSNWKGGRIVVKDFAGEVSTATGKEVPSFKTRIYEGLKEYGFRRVDRGIYEPKAVVSPETKKRKDVGPPATVKNYIMQHEGSTVEDVSSGTGLSTKAVAPILTKLYKSRELGRRKKDGLYHYSIKS